MRKKFTLALSLMGLFFLVGCLRVPAGLAPSNTPLKNSPYTVIGPAFGSDTHADLFGIIPLTRAEHIQHAIDEAVKNSDADALIDVTVETVSKYWLVFTTYTIEVRGKAIKYNRS